MSSPTDFHRLFGLAWLDFFDGTDVEVKIELDLSIQQQYIDLVIIRKGTEPFPRQLPDGFEPLVAHNLVTFKSYQEAIDSWTLQELVGHYSDYRKHISPSTNQLLPETDFRLFAVSTRFPANLSKEVNLVPVGPGVFDVSGLGLTIRVIVIRDLLEEQQNAMLLLFSARKKLIQYGRKHYQQYGRETSTLIYKLLNAYSEDPTMSETLKQFYRETVDELLKNLPPEERLKGLPAEELRNALPVEERLKGLSADELIRALSATLTPEQREALARHFKSNGSSSEPK